MPPRYVFIKIRMLLFFLSFNQAHRREECPSQLGLVATTCIIKHSTPAKRNRVYSGRRRKGRREVASFVSQAGERERDLLSVRL